MGYPLPRTSLYVGDLHPDVTEEDLCKTFGQIGPLASLRLCRDKLSCKSLCHAFVSFWFPGHAFIALRCLNHTILRGKSMRIMWYQRDPFSRMNSNGNLYVKNLNKSITSARLQEIFSKHGTVLSCKVAEENGISKGFGFVQFDSEDTAMAALNALHDTVLEGKKLYVSKFVRKIWRQAGEPGSKNLFVGKALKKAERKEQLSDPTLYVRNLDRSIDDRKLEQLFSHFGTVVSAKVIRNSDGVSKEFGFVRFSCQVEAKKAFNSLIRARFQGRTLYLAWAQDKEQQTNSLQQLYSHWPKQSYANFPPPPLCTYNHQPRHCNSPLFSPPIPMKQMIPWHPTPYQNLVGTFSPPNPFQPHNSQGACCTFPKQLASLDWCGQVRYEGIRNGLKPWSVQNKISTGDKKE
ncbi:UNVERIFIED_CONTAM: Polyadenylate-binding protein 6 [Sesamum radiatum]|uniref:Polyadenylate-binding protein 6 n=1 Tax=Sesamum radiatum TaxID=300843 RepID=A0AAW2PJB4_SESRA